MDIVDKVGACAQLWLEFKQDPDFKSFLEYNDVGLPLAYFSAEGLLNELTPLGEQYVLETFDMLLDMLNITEKEIDDILPNKDLGAILVYAYNKKKASGEE